MMIMMTIFEMIFLTSGSINERPSRCHTNILPRTGYIIKHFGKAFMAPIITLLVYRTVKKAKWPSRATIKFQIIGPTLGRKLTTL